MAKGGPSELFRGFLPSALRDAPYAGLFIVFYEGIKYETSKSVGYVSYDCMLMWSPRQINSLNVFARCSCSAQFFCGVS